MKAILINKLLGINRGGGEIWDLRMAEGLRGLGVDVTFYVGKPLFSELEQPVEGFPAVEVETPHLHDLGYAAPRGIGGALVDADNRLFARRAAKKIQEEDHDVVHVSGCREVAKFVDSFEGPVVNVLHGSPHSLWHDVVNPFSSSYRLLEAFDRVITTGVTTEEVRERCSVDVTTINPGVDTEEFTPKGETEGGEEGRTRLLFVGRFVPAKNLSLLLDAFSELVERCSDAQLRLVGGGPLEDRLRKRVESLGISGSVRFEGYVPNKELPRYYREADIFVLTSRTENHPITLLESMASGTPVVAPRLGWIPDIVDHEENGLLFEAGSKSDLVSSLEELLDNPSRRKAFGEHGREKAVENFDWESKARKLKEVYEELLED